MNQTIAALALGISATLLTDFRAIPKRIGLIGAILREIGRSARAMLGGQPRRERAALEFVRAHAVEGDAESVLRALDRFAREQRFMMNLGNGKGCILDELVAGLPSSARVLELGAYCGYSAVRMARLLRGGGQIISIEANPRHARIAKAMCRFAGVEDQVQIMVGWTGAIIPTLAGPFDLVFLDHSKDEYLVDLWRIEEKGLIEPGSIIVADNVGPLFDARDYLKYVRTNPYNLYRSRYVESHLEYYEEHPDGMEVSIWLGAGDDRPSMLGVA
ncbi:O-methyltransferase [Thiocapsa marina]|uniref:Catechol O-methyltransferase n=1 Tax=Thiocapsa marina 5811 TaxID=768671 RepID=F9U5E8_9GAMM|nr:class I SAM-dependent methyltransferase [Thiocapsa marina]EGV20371.1 Catechol O-methyltransferase [Thiocapsa marina 5811]